MHNGNTITAVGRKSCVWEKMSEGRKISKVRSVSGSLKVVVNLMREFKVC